MLSAAIRPKTARRSEKVVIGPWQKARASGGQKLAGMKFPACRNAERRRQKRQFGTCVIGVMGNDKAVAAPQNTQLPNLPNYPILLSFKAQLETLTQEPWAQTAPRVFPPERLAGGGERTMTIYPDCKTAQLHYLKDRRQGTNPSSPGWANGLIWRSGDLLARKPARLV